MFNRQVITSAGLALDTKIRAGLTKAEFTKVSLGDGKYTGAEDLGKVSGLKKVRQSFGISSITATEGNTVLLRVVVNNAGVIAGYYISEVGIYARDPDKGEILYSIALGVEGKMDYQPSEAELLNATSTFDYYVAVSNAENAITQVGTGAAASAEDLLNLKEDLRPTNTVSGTGSVSTPGAMNDIIKNLVIRGRSEQYSTKGLQLFDASVRPSVTRNGLVLTNMGDGSFTAVGTTTDIMDFYLLGKWGSEEVLIPGDISLMCEGIDETTRLSVVNNATAHTVNGNQITKITHVTGAFIRFQAGQTYNHRFFPMLYATPGDGARPNWEPYTGGKPGPNIQHPLPIKGVSDAIIKSTNGVAINTVSLDGYDLLGIGEVYDLVRLNNKLWENEKYYSTVELDGSEGWKLQSVNDYGVANFQAHVSDMKNIRSGLCTHLMMSKVGIADAKENGFYTSNMTLYIRLSADDLPDQTAEAFKAYLAAEKSKGTPVIVIYQIITPVKEPLSDELQTQLNTLKTYEGEHSSISVISEVLADLEVEYYRKTPITSALLPAMDRKIYNNLSEAHRTRLVTLEASGWTGSAAPYIQAVLVDGITEDMEPILVRALPDDASETGQKAYEKAFSIISAGSGTTGSGNVTFKVYKKPVTTIDVGLKGV